MMYSIFKLLSLAMVFAISFNAMAEDIAPDPSMGPQPHAAPMLPGKSVDGDDNQDALIDRLMRRIASLDKNIEKLRREQDGTVVRVVKVDNPLLEEARQRRNRSWLELEDALREHEVIESTRDIIDRPGNDVQDAVERRLRAENQLAIARCYLDLALAQDGQGDHFAQARESLHAVVTEDLPVQDRPRLYYYWVNVALEQAQMSSGEDRIKYIKEARQQVSELQRRFPQSYLGSTAESLVASVTEQSVSAELDSEMVAE